MIPGASLFDTYHDRIRRYIGVWFTTRQRRRSWCRRLCLCGLPAEADATSLARPGRERGHEKQTASVV